MMGLTYKRSKEYNCWLDLRRRCNTKTCKAYKNYGGRGIKVCKEWDSFKTFLLDMDPKPFDDSTIDRIDVNGNYHKENCRWVSRKIQNVNRRNVKQIFYLNETKCLTEWCDVLKIPYQPMRKRVYDQNLSFEEALSKSFTKKSLEAFKNKKLC